MERTLFAAFASIQDDMVRVRTAYLKALHHGFAVFLPVCAGMALLSHEIITVALGPNWKLAVPVLAFIAPATALYLIAGLSNSLTNALGQPRALFRYKMLSLLIHIPVMAAAVWYFGLIGALAACLLTAFLWYLMSIHVAAKVTGLTHWSQASVLMRTVFSALVMSAVVILVREFVLGGPADGLFENILNAAILAAVGAAAHIGCHVLLWQVTGRGEGVERTVTEFVSRRIGPREA